MTEISSPGANDERLARLYAQLAESGIELGPRPERMSESYAEERIREKIMHFDEARPQAGLWSINEALKGYEVPAALRLHLITAVAHLGRISKTTLDARRARSGAGDPW